MVGVRTTVLVVDDHAGFRRSAAALLAADGFDVVGEAVDGEGALEAVDKFRPDVVLLDIQLPGIDGLALTERIGVGPGKPAIVLISGREPSAYGQRLRDSLARGFVAKSALSGAAIRALLA